MGFDAVQCGTKLPMFQRDLLLPSSGYNEDRCKTLAPTTLQCHIPYDPDCNTQYSDNISVCVDEL